MNSSSSMRTDFYLLPLSHCQQHLSSSASKQAHTSTDAQVPSEVAIIRSCGNLAPLWRRQPSQVLAVPHGHHRKDLPKWCCILLSAAPAPARTKWPFRRCVPFCQATYDSDPKTHAGGEANKLIPPKMTRQYFAYLCSVVEAGDDPANVKVLPSLVLTLHERKIQEVGIVPYFISRKMEKKSCRDGTTPMLLRGPVDEPEFKP